MAWLGKGHVSSPLLQRTCDFDTREALDLVVHANVLIVLHADTALRSGSHFVHVVLKAAQGFERPFEDHDVVAQNADRIVATDEALDDEATRDHTELAGAEH